MSFVDPSTVRQRLSDSKYLSFGTKTDVNGIPNFCCNKCKKSIKWNAGTTGIRRHLMKCIGDDF